jgi:hypothetical protein
MLCAVVNAQDGETGLQEQRNSRLKTGVYLTFLKRNEYPSFQVEYHPASRSIVLYSSAMSTLIIPLLITFALGVAAFLAHRTMNQMHRRLLDSELGGRDYNHLSDHDRYFLNETVNLKFHQSIGGMLASFVLLYAYPTLFIGEKMLGRTQWSAVEVISGSSLFYFLVLALMTQVILIQG